MSPRSLYVHTKCVYYRQESSSTVQSVLEIMEQIIPPLTANYQNLSPMGSTARAQKALEDLHTRGKKIETTSDQLMVRITDVHSNC